MLLFYFFFFSLLILYWTNTVNSNPVSIGKILHQPHVHSYSLHADDCNCTKITCTYSKCIYLLLKEMATSWSIWLYGAIIIIYF